VIENRQMEEGRDEEPADRGRGSPDAERGVEICHVKNVKPLEPNRVYVLAVRVRASSQLMLQPELEPVRGRWYFQWQ
jgi:hypothetical protein